MSATRRSSRNSPKRDRVAIRCINLVDSLLVAEEVLGIEPHALQRMVNFPRAEGLEDQELAGTKHGLNSDEVCRRANEL